MSQITDHYVIAIRLRFSDGGKQSDMSNETQQAEIMAALAAAGHRPHIAMVIAHEHSAYDPEAYRLEEDLARVTKYNHKNPNPVTLLLHYDWARWMRNSTESNYWRYRFKQVGVEINAATRWLDVDDSHGRLYLQFEQHQAEEYSRSIGQNVIRANTGWKAKGYNPHPMTTLYFTREGMGTHDRRNVWLPTRQNLAQAIDLILSGSTLAHAKAATGGREVHGADQTFSDNLRKEYMMGRDALHTFNYAPITTEAKWQQLQQLLKGNRVLSKDERSLQSAWLCGVVVANGCGRRVSRSTPKRKGKASAKYYICPCKPVRHYRVHRDQAEADMLSVLSNFALTASRQVDLSKKADERARVQLDRLRTDARRLEKKAKEAAEIVRAAKKKYVLDKITEADLNEYKAEERRLTAQLEETRSQIAHYGEILEAVKDSIANIGTFLANHANKLQLRDFVMMLFPDGLLYDPEKRQFRTTQINAAYSIIADKSVSYRQIKFGVPVSDMGTPVVGGRPGRIRTPQSDLRAFTHYRTKYAV